MAVTATSVKALGGAAFSGVADATVDTWLSVAANQVSESMFGDLYDNALTFWTLHALASTTLSGAGASGATGPVTSVKVGAVSAGYAAASGGFGSLSSTQWGKMYLDLARMVVSPISANTCRSV